MSRIDYTKLDDHPKGAVCLFKVMMRLEFALKAIGFVIYKRGRLEICWDKFANKRLTNEFFATIHDSGKANTLIQCPPSHQIIKNGVLEFDNAGPVRSVQDLLSALRRVRNNLFHGGKSGDPDHGRNDILIEEAISVIREILLNNSDLLAEFEGNY